MLYMIAHSLSSVLHGRRPVDISRITQPSDQISAAPEWREWDVAGKSPRITSGDMYIGVPVIVFCGLPLGRTGAAFACLQSAGIWFVR